MPGQGSLQQEGLHPLWQTLALQHTLQATKRSITGSALGSTAHLHTLLQTLVLQHTLQATKRSITGSALGSTAHLHTPLHREKAIVSIAARGPATRMNTTLM